MNANETQTKWMSLQSQWRLSPSRKKERNRAKQEEEEEDEKLNTRNAIVEWRLRYKQDELTYLRHGTGLIGDECELKMKQQKTKKKKNCKMTKISEKKKYIQKQVTKCIRKGKKHKRY